MWSKSLKVENVGKRKTQIKCKDEKHKYEKGFSEAFEENNKSKIGEKPSNTNIYECKDVSEDLRIEAILVHNHFCQKMDKNVSIADCEIQGKLLDITTFQFTKCVRSYLLKIAKVKKN